MKSKKQIEFENTCAFFYDFALNGIKKAYINKDISKEYIIKVLFEEN